MSCRDNTDRPHFRFELPAGSQKYGVSPVHGETLSLTLSVHFFINFSSLKTFFSSLEGTSRITLSYKCVSDVPNFIGSHPVNLIWLSTAFETVSYTDFRSFWYLSGVDWLIVNWKFSLDNNWSRYIEVDLDFEYISRTLSSGNIVRHLRIVNPSWSSKNDPLDTFSSLSSSDSLILYSTHFYGF